MTERGGSDRETQAQGNRQQNAGQQGRGTS